MASNDLARARLPCRHVAPQPPPNLRRPDLPAQCLVRIPVRARIFPPTRAAPHLLVADNPRRYERTGSDNAAALHGVPNEVSWGSSTKLID